MNHDISLRSALSASNLRLLAPIYLLAATILAAIPVVLPTRAAELAAPSGEVILTIAGSVTKKNAGTNADIDRAMLEALPQHEVTTATPWFDGETTFSGPFLKDVIALAGGSGEWATVTALDEYSVDVPVSDFDAYLPILAMTRDGKAMPADDKGPLFIIYDYDSDPKLNTDEFHSRSVWSVRSIELE